MHFACRHRSSHNAVKLLRPQLLWHTNRLHSVRYYASHQPGFDLPPGHTLEGSYTPSLTPNPRAQNIAVLGGGIAGLASAFNLSNDLPDAKITIFEANDKPGGWVDSERVEVNDGKVLFEWGPRSLRPDMMGNGLATLRLIHQLAKDKNSQTGIIGIPRSHPAATNRFIYYPDRLVKMPGPSPSGLIATLFNTVRSVISEPIFKGVVWNLAAEASVATRADNVKDESVGSFISRRYGKTVADNLLSALFHGIYAGNIYNLSARTLLPKLWYLETRDSDGNGINTEMLELMFKQQTLHSWETIKSANRASADDASLKDKDIFHTLLQGMRQCSVYTFVNGISGLTTNLTRELLENKNVKVETGAKVSGISFDDTNRKFAVACGDGYKASDFDYVVSTLPPTTLANALSAEESSKTQHKSLISSLGHSPKAVNVMVVNLYYESANLAVPRGFGYLIPRSIPVPQNPERALGVIFGSETAGPRGEASMIQAMQMKADFDRSSPEWKKIQESGDEQARLDHMAEVTEVVDKQIGQDSATGTKLAVMLGGHWWDGWSESDLPSENEGIEMAKSVIARHLGITEQPLVAKARMQRDCIPQYQIGYRDDMAQIHQNLVSDFGGRMKVTGVWWQGGVGLNDSVMGAREVSRAIREGWDGETGLEKYVGEEKWYIRDGRTGVSVKDPLGPK